jgi:hypothetical protein
VILALVLGAAWLYKGNGSAASPAAASSISIEVGPVREEQDQGVIFRGEPNIGEQGSESGQVNERGIVEAACGLIERGKFNAAGQLIKASDLISEGNSPGAKKDGELIKEVEGIVGQWQKLQKGRQLQKEKAYKEQLAALEKVLAGKTDDVNLKDVQVFAERWLEDSEMTSQGGDVNEQGGPTAVLAAVMRTIEFADEQQKKALLSEPCVQSAMAVAKSEAAALEQKGKWLDAYIRCYSWLSALEPNNKDYSDHAEQLIDKAEIAGSFQDSPCETGKQRFEGVRRRIFEWAVGALNFNYISKIDYRQMAAKGARRCRQLVEVVGTLTRTEDRRRRAWGGSRMFRYWGRVSGIFSRTRTR